MAHLVLIRIFVVLTALTGAIYIVWRWGFSLNWDAWWIAVPLIAAETYAFVDVLLFCLTVWRSRARPVPEPPADDATVDVFITTYNESVDLVRNTAVAAREIRGAQTVWILDDGARPAMRDLADELGIGYVSRGREWDGRPRHAKAGNLNNALMQTWGEFVLILDADQIPKPEMLENTLGYFRDDNVALVQTPQRFSNVAAGDPLGSQAPLFYGPIQQGKDGWNAAFFCGSNAILRRDALMRLGLLGYAAAVERSVTIAVRESARVVRRARRDASAMRPEILEALNDLESALGAARLEIKAGKSLSEITYRLRRRADEIDARLVNADLALLQSDLQAIGELSGADSADEIAGFDPTLAMSLLDARELSPLGAIGSVREVLARIDVDRADEAQPIMPLATISVTEDLATSMRLHALGYRSVYHHEVLADGLAPEDLGSALTQRLRWAQGTIQVLLRENPLTMRGLKIPQRLLYFATMWSYFTGFAAIAFLAGPVIFLCFGILPVDTTALEFFLRFLPYLVVNQVLFLIVGKGIPTWRGQQYNLALFPVFIRAVWTAAANVWFGRPLSFAVTDKSGVARRSSVRMVFPQTVAAIVLIVSTVIGVIRLILLGDEPIGTVVNIVWVAYDLVALSVLIGAVRYRGFQVREKEVA